MFGDPGAGTLQKKLTAWRIAEIEAVSTFFKLIELGTSARSEIVLEHRKRSLQLGGLQKSRL
ncbi:hypothetical protein [Paenibacillus sp. N3.4]|uniref:hypothetical protein n=1 Tax=Paenibacillus sp. N3.4 TaxID=2603222 RepID=UPI0011CC7627|nr:hypothetical protein [Paenibacillus sp. N3.4]TXK84509.1 hypothetical protein FU659_08850 [Paenibacillus sp. N3.4]